MQDANFWHDKWKTGQIGFHQEDIHPFLKKYWKRTGLKRRSTVFVPLCGKSKDMLFLRSCSHDVIGVELSGTAAQDFFTENQLKSVCISKSDFDHHIGNGLSIMVGDFFKVNKTHMKTVSAVYDRAALIALPAKMRIKYADHLRSILKPGTLIFLIALSYDQSQMEGPPFNVSEDEITSLFGDWCNITQVFTNEPEDFRGIPATESIYQIEVA